MTTESTLSLTQRRHLKSIRSSLLSPDSLNYELVTVPNLTPSGLASIPRSVTCLQSQPLDSEPHLLVFWGIPVTMQRLSPFLLSPIFLKLVLLPLQVPDKVCATTYHPQLFNGLVTAAYTCAWSVTTTKESNGLAKYTDAQAYSFLRDFAW